MSIFIKGDRQMKLHNALKVFTAIGALLGTSSAIAVPPHLPNVLVDGNEWSITGYLDTAQGHTQLATQTLCFFDAGFNGTHQQYYWVSTSYPDWNGFATQEGDQIFMYGDFRWPFNNRDGGHDGMQWEIVTDNPKNVGAGHWQEWIEDGRLGIPVVFANAVFKRTGKCPYDTVGEAFEKGQTLDIQIDKNGQALSPFGLPVNPN
jgi:hypothetical protein